MTDSRSIRRKRRASSEREALQYETNKNFKHIVMIDFRIEHLSGKEAVELVRAQRK